MDLRTLPRRVRYWQRKLGLTQWKIRVVVLPQVGMACKNSLGNINFDYETMSAKIRLTDPKDREHDLESTMLHELLHIVWDMGEEQGIDRMVGVLRKGKGKVKL